MCKFKIKFKSILDAVYRLKIPGLWSFNVIKKVQSVFVLWANLKTKCATYSTISVTERKYKYTSFKNLINTQFQPS